ncbi:pilus assembly protein TadG-related protein, partial [Streptomyces sp. NPDC059456]|uniref:pilus assembly protein TadG-related protein n=1 Tax=Streptomyces sp. NPDC059456 TaxID=3346838 RepID=UPI0036AB7C85
MSRRGLRDDRGQAFPIYAVAVVGLLFAALAFFVVGQAGVTRSNAQGAADAAALAAAGEARDSAFLGLDLLGLKPADWEKLVDGDLLTGNGACQKADEFAALNDATAECAAAIPGGGAGGGVSRGAAGSGCARGAGEKHNGCAT